MNYHIYITEINRKIELSAGLYILKVLGGWEVILNGFFITLKNIESNEVIRPKNTFWKTQTFSNGSRAKKIALIIIPENGIYEIKFIKPERLKVKNQAFFYLIIFKVLSQQAKFKFTTQKNALNCMLPV